MRARFRKKESRSFFLSICAQLAFNVKTTSFWYDLWAGGNSVIESIKGGLFYENGGERMTVKLRKDSQIPAYKAELHVQRQGLRKTYTQDARDRLQKAHGKQYSPITMMEAQQDVDHLLREDERKLEPPTQKRPVRHQPEPQKKPPKRDYER